MSDGPETRRVSVIVPVFNEAGTLERVLSAVLAQPLVGEVIVVDDASTDGTRALLEKIRPSLEFKLVLLPENRGKGAAIRAGFARVTREFVIVQDADLEYDPGDFPELFGPLLRGEADAVYGVRNLGNFRSGLLHTFGNRLVTGLSNLLHALHLKDMETCYKAVRFSVLKRIRLRSDRFGFEPEVTAHLSRLGVRIREVPIRYRPRGYSEGKKLGMKDALETVVLILALGLLR